MPYLDVNDPENFVHLLQLFLAAHSEDRVFNEAARDQKDMPGEYFLSKDGCRRLAVWARKRHLIRRKDADRLWEVAGCIFQRPWDVVTLTPRVLGRPPRLQPTVLSTELHAWLYVCAPEQEVEVMALTLEAAIRIMAHVRDDATEPDHIRARAQELHDWLAAQPASWGSRRFRRKIYCEPCSP